MTVKHSGIKCVMPECIEERDALKVMHKAEVSRSMEHVRMLRRVRSVLERYFYTPPESKHEMMEDILALVEKYLKEIE